MRARQLVLVRGSRDRTEATILDRLAVPDPAVAWIAEPAPSRAFHWLRPHEVAGALGAAFDVVVVDAHAGLDPELLGCVHGLVHGGGTLILRLPDRDEPWTNLDRLAAWPHSPDEVGHRFVALVEAALSRYASPLPASIGLGDRAEGGTPEQAVVVERLVARWSARASSRTTLIADRGRGKSSALGLALARLADPARAPDDRPLLVTAGTELAVAELLRFAGPRARFVALLELIATPDLDAVIVVDEAAQLPVALLQRLVLAHPRAELSFATTTHGYEGTGRGFGLRFVTWLERQGPVERLELHTPIRWVPDDPVEQAVFAALLLDAEPAALSSAAAAAPPASSALELRRLDRDALARDPAQLRALFGLLVHAHYRTTPGDLQRLLDAPNLEVHAALLDHQIVAACLVADEGGLTPELCEAAAAGRTRLRAHALADVLVAHLGREQAGALPMRRSVRIATHPSVRRHGVATRLVEHVHAEAHAGPKVELWGTLFGATPELVEFRRRLGYVVVRISASRGVRTGEPSLLMLRPVSEAAAQLVAELRDELARELEVQLSLLAADEGLRLDPALVAAIRDGLPSVVPYTAREQRTIAERYAYGPRTFESVATALRGFIDTLSPHGLDVLPPELRALVVARVVQLQGWHRVTTIAGFASPAAAMRGLRRAIRLLLTNPRDPSA